MASLIEMEELSKPKNDLQKISTKEAESIIRDDPVPIKEKRKRRSDIMLASKKSWHEKMKEYLRGIMEDLPHLKLWQEDLKLIEGKFGASIVSYFVFIRWLLFMNVIILCLNLVFLVLPHYTFLSKNPEIATNLTLDETKTANFSLTKDLRKELLHNEINLKPIPSDVEEGTQTINLHGSQKNWPQFEAYDEALLNTTKTAIDLIKYCHFRYLTAIENVTTTGFFVHIQNFLQGTGYLEESFLFIGSYPMEEVLFLGNIYYMPLAVIWVLTISFSLSLFMMIQFSSFGVKEAVMTHQHFLSFSNDMFCGWDYCIASQKAAMLHHDKFAIQLKSTLSEAHLKMEISKRTAAEGIEIYYKRIGVQIIVVLYLICCYIIIYNAALFQLEAFKSHELEEAGLRSLVIQFLPSITCVSINFISLVLFDFLVTFEQYHGQKAVNMTLIRNNFSNLSSIFVLVCTFYLQIICKPRGICGSGRSDHCRTPRCWETYVGQQLYKLSVMQLLLIIGIFLFVDIPRNYIAKNFNNKYTKMIGRPPFLLPIEVLEPLYAQAVLWQKF